MMRHAIPPRLRHRTAMVQVIPDQAGAEDPPAPECGDAALPRRQRQEPLVSDSARGDMQPVRVKVGRRPLVRTVHRHPSVVRKRRKLVRHVDPQHIARPEIPGIAGNNAIISVRSDRISVRSDRHRAARVHDARPTAQPHAKPAAMAAQHSRRGVSAAATTFRMRPEPGFLVRSRLRTRSPRSYLFDSRLRSPPDGLAGS